MSPNKTIPYRRRHRAAARLPLAADASLGDRLREVQIERGLTLRELAKLITGVSRETVRRCRLGQPLSPFSRVKIKAFLEGADARGLQ